MNRADLLYSVLKDGKPKSRREIFARVGYMLTNNAASELRARGFDVQHSREGRVDVYVLVRGGGLALRGTTAPAPSNEQVTPHVSPDATCSTIPAPGWLGEPALSPSPGGAASGGTHPSCGTGAGQDSGDTAAGRASWCAAGNGTTCPASPEQLSIEDALAGVAA